MSFRESSYTRSNIYDPLYHNTPEFKTLAAWRKLGYEVDLFKVHHLRTCFFNSRSSEFPLVCEPEYRDGCEGVTMPISKYLVGYRDANCKKIVLRSIVLL